MGTFCIVTAQGMTDTAAWVITDNTVQGMADITTQCMADTTVQGVVDARARAHSTGSRLHSAWF